MRATGSRWPLRREGATSTHWPGFEPAYAGVVVTAGDLYELRLQRGRLLRGWPLAMACVFRNLAISLLPFVYEDELVAPAWVIVQDRRTGLRVGRVAAGREPFAAEALLAAMQYDSAFLGPEQFVSRHGVR
jgi:hypothetical protein